jgi:hypothetical protein
MRTLVLTLRFDRGVTFLAVALGAAVFSFALTAPARAESTPPGSPLTTLTSPHITPPAAPPLHSALRRAPAPGANAGAAAAQLAAPTAGRSNQSLTTGQIAPRLSPAVADPVVGVHGQLNIGRSHMYVPYYGDVAGGTNAESQGVAGLGYGFGSWNLAVVNRSLGTDLGSMVQNMKAINPSLSLSIRF